MGKDRFINFFKPKVVQKKLIKLFNYFLEKNISSKAAMILTVSEYLRIKLQEIVPSRIEIIPNGFNEFKGVNVRKSKSDVLTISYVGTIYPWHPVERFIGMLEDLIKEGEKIKVNFYGINNEEKIKAIINRYEILNQVVNFIPRLSEQELFVELKRTDVLLLFNDYLYPGTKIYTYLAAKRKILFLYENDPEALEVKEKYYNIDDKGYNIRPQIDIIRETNSGIIVKDEEHLKSVLKELYAEFKQKGYIECKSRGIEKYSRERQAEKLVNLIKENVLKG